MKLLSTLFLLSLVFLFSDVNGQIYVSLDGDDNNSGSIDEPLASIKEALRKIDDAGGYTIYVRGGVYNIFSPLKLEDPGNANNYNKLASYPGEKAVLDFSEQPLNSAARGILMTSKHWLIDSLEIRGCGDNGIHISGDSNKVANSEIHHCRDTGIQISNGGSYNIVENCDSYLNFDPGSKGENADGFAAKLDIGPGNEFHGCRAWNNADDGWDLYEGQESVLIDSCWAFRNGYNIWGISNFQGDGNGFKLGGNFIPANHTISNSVAFDNRGKGFDQNHNTSGVMVYNCTAWDNSRNYVFPQPPQDTVKSVFKNNISLDGSIDIDGSSIEENNSWQGFTVTANDFRSLDTTLATASRIWNNKLPQNDFLRLTSGSSLIDAGIDVGFPYNGSAPDLGAFEFGTILGTNDNKELAKNFTLYQNYPNPFNPTTIIRFSIPSNIEQGISKVQLVVYNSLGQKVRILVNDNKVAGNYEVEFNASNLTSGVYFYNLLVGGQSFTQKMLLVK